MKAVQFLRKWTYVNNITDSFNSVERAENVKTSIKKIIQPGFFIIRKWLTSWKDPSSGDKSMLNNVKDVNNEKLLEMQWNPKEDVFRFSVHLKF